MVDREEFVEWCDREGGNFSSRYDWIGCSFGDGYPQISDDEALTISMKEGTVPGHFAGAKVSLPQGEYNGVRERAVGVAKSGGDGGPRDVDSLELGDGEVELEGEHFELEVDIDSWR